MCDQDPEQDIEEEFRNKHNQVFTWRFLREISFIDLVNFLGRPENPNEKTKSMLFDGDPEEQARIMYNNKDGRFKHKQIQFKQPA